MVNKQPIITKVAIRKDNGQKLVYLPKNSDLKEGDYVLIKKLEVEDEFIDLVGV